MSNIVKTKKHQNIASSITRADVFRGLRIEKQYIFKED